jgi:O-antigen ligase
MALTPVLPHVPLAGPLSLDDVFPVFATIWGLAVVLVQRRPIRVLPLAAALAVVVVGTVVSAVGGGQMSTLLSGTMRWTQVLAVVVLAATLIDNARAAAWFGRAMVAVITGEALFGLIAFALRWSGPGGYIGIEKFIGYESVARTFPGRITGTLGMASTFVAGLFALGLPLAVGFALRSKKRWEQALFAAASLLTATALFFTFSRVALVVGGVTAFALLCSRISWKIWAPLVLVTITAVLLTPMRTRLFQDGNDRLQLWWAGLSMWRDHLFFGVGSGRYMQALPEYAKTPAGTAGSTPHNSIILAGAELGVIAALGLTAALALALLVLIPAWRDPDVLMLALVMGFFSFTACAMFANLFFIPSIAMGAWAAAAAAQFNARAWIPLKGPQVRRAANT